MEAARLGWRPVSPDHPNPLSRINMRKHALLLALGIPIVAVSCVAPVRSAGPLGGQWAVSFLDRSPEEMNIDGGVVVFDARIPCYCTADSELADDAVIGRAYLDLSAVGQSPRPTTDLYFGTGPDSDYYEEVVARVEGGRVTIRTRGPAGLSLDGTLIGDSVRGEWAYLSHGDTLSRGGFVLRREHSTVYLDSAVVRGRRGVKEWMNEPPLNSAEPVDTAPPVQELPPSRP
jgi:hypothetical protein